MMDRGAQGASKTPSGTVERLRSLPLEALIGLVDNVMSKLNDPGADPALMASALVAIRHIAEAIEEKGGDPAPLISKIETMFGERGGDPLSAPAQVMAMRLAMVMDHLGQYSLADRLDAMVLEM